MRSGRTLDWQRIAAFVFLCAAIVSSVRWCGWIVDRDSNFWIAVFTVILTGIAYLQWVATKEATRVSTVANQISRMALHQSRPALMIERMPSIIQAADADGMRFVEVHIVIKNYGQTAAVIERMRLRMKTVRGELPKDLSDCYVLEYGSSVAVPPDLSWQCTPDSSDAWMSAETVRGFGLGDTHLIVYGEIKYTDLAGRPYATTFTWVRSGNPTEYVSDRQSPLDFEQIPGGLNRFV